jgi:hypothetical protein
LTTQLPRPGDPRYSQGKWAATGTKRIMASNNKLGTVGIVRPTARSSGFEDLLRMLAQ